MPLLRPNARPRPNYRKMRSECHHWVRDLRADLPSFRFLWCVIATLVTAQGMGAETSPTMLRPATVTQVLSHGDYYSEDKELLLGSLASLSKSEFPNDTNDYYFQRKNILLGLAHNAVVAACPDCKLQKKEGILIGDGKSLANYNRYGTGIYLMQLWYLQPDAAAQERVSASNDIDLIRPATPLNYHQPANEVRNVVYHFFIDDLANEDPHGLWAYEKFGVTNNRPTDPGPSAFAAMGLDVAEQVGLVEHAIATYGTDPTSKEFIDHLVPALLHIVASYKKLSEGVVVEKKFDLQAEVLDEQIPSVADYEVNETWRRDAEGRLQRHIVVALADTESRVKKLKFKYSTHGRHGYYAACHGYTLVTTLRLTERICAGFARKLSETTRALPAGMTISDGGAKLELAGLKVQIPLNATLEAGEQGIAVEGFDHEQLLVQVASTVYEQRQELLSNPDDGKQLYHGYRLFAIARFLDAAGYPEVLGNWHWRHDFTELAKNQLAGGHIKGEDRVFYMLVLARAYRPLFRM